jgi:hypothetical protein
MKEGGGAIRRLFLCPAQLNFPALQKNLLPDWLTRPPRLF